MADTLPNIDIPLNEWVDLYALSGIEVGTPITVENIGTHDVFLAVRATQPPPEHDSFVILKRSGQQYRNSLDDAGAWAFCNTTKGKVNVRESQ